jgi:hypothetical protein
MATPTKKSPLARMKEQFKDKETLVDRILGLLESGDEPKEQLKTKLLAASNKKLLRLLGAASEIKSKYGGTQGLAEAAAKAAGKAKDRDYVARLVGLAKRTPSRVLDLLTAVEKRGKSASA